jgi:hypothetical protein
LPPNLQGPAALADRARLETLDRPETHLALVKSRYQNIRANVLYAPLDQRGRGRIQISAELPLLYAKGRHPFVLILAALSTGCVIQSAMTLVPGAAQVKITTNLADIAGCTAVGYIPTRDINIPDQRVAQNEAVPLNADVVFNTGYGGVAYRCHK